MTSTRIDWSFHKIAKLTDAADLGEMLFPANRNQQHAFLIIWIALKWQPHRMVPNLGEAVRGHGVSRRTLERVRAKLRRLGLLDRISRFNTRYGGVEGWALSSRFEHSLRVLADRIGAMKDSARGSREKDEMLIDFAKVRRNSLRMEKSSRSGIPIRGDEE